MILLIILVVAKSIQCMNISFTQIVTNQSINDFGADWSIDYDSSASRVNIRNLNGSQIKLALNQSVKQIIGQGIIPNISKFAIITNDNKLQTLNYTGRSLNLEYTSNLTYSKIIFGKDPFIYAISYDKKKLFKIDIKNKVIVKNISFSDEEALDFHFQEKLVAVTKNRYTGKFYLLDQNLGNQKVIYFDIFYYTSQYSIRYDFQTNTIVRTSTRTTKIWSFDTSLMIKSVSKITSPFTNILQSSVICNGFLIVLQGYFYSFYNLSTWQRMNTTQPVKFETKKNIKCFKSQNRIGFYNQNSIQKSIKYIDFAWAPTPSFKLLPQDLNPIIPTIDPTQLPPINSSGNSVANSSDFNQSMDNGVSPPLQNNKSDTTLVENAFQSEVTKSLNKISSQVAATVLSQNSKKGAGVMSSTASITSAATITKPALRPAVNLFEDLWFYGYHQKIYPQFVMMFTAEVDVFNELRIKPQFINTTFPIQRYIVQNSKYNESSILQPRAPDKIFMLESIKDIYTINIGIVFLTFFGLNGLRILLGLIPNKSEFINKVYQAVYVNSLWWTLFIGFFQSNIVPIAFYGSIQFNVFVSFDFFSKFNNLFTVLMFFAIFAFCFLFYPIISEYGKKQQAEEFFQFCQLNQQSFWLEMTLKCLRGFFQSIIHGFFINRNLIQLSGLIFLDIGLITLMLYFRRKFAHRITFILFFLYYLLFLIFDSSLLSYTIQSTTDSEFNEQLESQYNFAFVVIILSLFAVTIMKVLAILGFFVYETIKDCRSSNKIENELKDGNSQKDQKTIKEEINTQISKQDKEITNKSKNKIKKTIMIKKSIEDKEISRTKKGFKGEKKIKGSNLSIKFKSQEAEAKCVEVIVILPNGQEKKENISKRKRVGTDVPSNPKRKEKTYIDRRSNKIKQQNLINAQMRQQKILTTFRRDRIKQKNQFKISL